jgi:uncharacterized coiled-coil DUF342 family protein
VRKEIKKMKEETDTTRKTSDSLLQEFKKAEKDLQESNRLLDTAKNGTRAFKGAAVK